MSRAEENIQITEPVKRWYVAQVFAGYEAAAQKEIECCIRDAGVQDMFGQILVPSARVKSFFTEEDSKDQQLFPGYLLVEMISCPEAIKVVNTARRVLRFLGGTDPISLSKKEVERVVKQMKGEVVIKTEVVEFDIGSEVDIVEGPFSGFVGLIEKVDTENEKLTVMVTIFGRMTPVELSFNQVKH
ncbi:transcription termination/antitermination factor NusG [bacterium]|nr:transcription termination/antitermination factor NusG [bacterium]MBT3903482.1 transcription termination/antitermination factor NusG [bacterium]MBT4577538.1 transcription termination/antitermination factor NusG [bacterium]MBT5345828.1 transcription termination/antitermination factor NusG [bacterium]MBT6131284.1 transcription termination/antitermination factor NusG [bacterium]